MRYVLAVLAMTTAASAQSPQMPCGPSKTMEDHIRDKYGESAIGMGIAAGGVMALMANPETGTFTVLIRRPDGMSCLLMGGTGFTSIEALKSGTDL